MNKHSFFSFLLTACFATISFFAPAQGIHISHNPQGKTVQFGNKELQLTLDYNGKANISSAALNGQSIIQGDSGIYSAIRVKDTMYSTLRLLSAPVVKTGSNTVTVSNIRYGNLQNPVSETWIFTITSQSIQYKIERALSKPLTAEQIALPVFTFKDTSVWEGAYTGYGGLAWFYLFNKPLDTYGVHSHASQFWNSKTNTGLDIAVSAPGKEIAMDYSRTASNQIAYAIAVAPTEPVFRFDSGTNRRRFIRDRTDVWADINMNAGTTTETIMLTPFRFSDRFGRGTMPGINGEQVSAVLNTIARIGVIDKQHFGGNSWHTPYGPICLHEQYIAQMGLAINDSNYLKGYEDCLNFYRDNAITKEGRVLPRWAYSNEDAMPGKYTDKGFYEAQWGYLLDSNPDFVTNVSDLYNQTGDNTWVKTQETACEKALDWIIKRDSNGNGLVEMMTDSTAQKRGSDWIDIIWASYENAFVNAKLYHALTLWAGIEKQLGNTTKGIAYREAARKLKESFNKPTSEGGFWDTGKQCYIHWRDKDGSVHGNNMVTPVNFMAIAYGICDDEVRKKTILDNIEMQMQKENLFFWPLCMYSYAPGEGNDWQFPFPGYENGDIFLSWGSIAVQAYASYKPEIAVRYIKNVLAQYTKDGLAFQRYGRTKQDGLGDDILAGNCLSVVGLYQSVYGINPLYNRFYLAPHITPELAGTELNYTYRNQKLIIRLDTNRYAVSDGMFTLIAAHDFGFFSTVNQLSYFHKDNDQPTLQVVTRNNGHLTIEIGNCESNLLSWKQSSGNALTSCAYTVNNLLPRKMYTLTVDGKRVHKLMSSAAGSLQFSHKANHNNESIRLVLGND